VTPTAKAVGMAGGTFYGNESLHPVHRTVLCYPHPLTIKNGQWIVERKARFLQIESLYSAKSKTAGRNAFVLSSIYYYFFNVD
jgi:hypothetical protein